MCVRFAMAKGTISNVPPALVMTMLFFAAALAHGEDGECGRKGGRLASPCERLGFRRWLLGIATLHITTSRCIPSLVSAFGRGIIFNYR